MNIIIVGTNEVKTLTLIDPKTGVCYLRDFIGNHESWEYSDDGDECLTTENYEWWENVVLAYGAAHLAAHEFKNELDGVLVDSFETFIRDIGNEELEDQAGMIHSAIEQFSD